MGSEMCIRDRLEDSDVNATQAFNCESTPIIELVLVYCCEPHIYIVSVFLFSCQTSMSILLTLRLTVGMH